MSDRNFREMLDSQWDQNKLVCVGLDSDLAAIPVSARRYKGDSNQLDIASTILNFNYQIVDATADVAAVFKLQSAFYEEQGPAGLAAMLGTVQYIRQNYPHIPIINDAKRGDVGNANDAYARAFVDGGFDAITLNPYVGIGAFKAFLDLSTTIGKGCIFLCRTSNPEAREFQDLIVKYNGTEMPLWQVVAYQAVNVWSKKAKGNLALVAGATYPDELGQIRDIVGNMPLLVPGVGKQGGKPYEVVAQGGKHLMINSSRAIIFASNGEDFAAAARREALKLHEAISLCFA